MPPPFLISFKNRCQNQPLLALHSLSCQELLAASTLALSLSWAEHTRTLGSLHPLSGLPNAAPDPQLSCRQPQPPRQPPFSPSCRHPSCSRSTSRDDVGSRGGRRSACQWLLLQFA